MYVHLAIPVGLLALVTAAGGVVAVTRGWVPRKVRQGVKRPHVYGWGLLAAAFSIGLLAADWAIVADREFRMPGQMLAVMVMGLSSGVIQASRRPADGDRHDGGKS
ncbi:hypothetical protein ABZ341_36935 [Streptomyces sp. NPDC006173]|uniref:hypothetical protein n=1 Tax=Streptomyces sp. NPDC006173 TaxID=3155349 RepID=UPI0033C4E027